MLSFLNQKKREKNGVTLNHSHQNRIEPTIGLLYLSLNHINFHVGMK